ncbi:MAG: hypothetical protein KF752_11755 [Pirellulaceae bacterium]|nr:hypothetical protein [Pirellulaceae bacterium]
MKLQTPLPIQGECCEDFCIRAHSQMLSAVPDAKQRNQLIWDAWDMMHPTPEKYAASQKFSAYRMVPAVCYFAEHTIGTRNGPFTVGPVELKAICQNQNRRIREAGLYPPLIDRHTGGIEPQIVGYSGVFRIGMFGDQEQKFGIFGDEFHKPQFQAVVDSKPRRSVELLRFADSSRNFFDPIACLGAEAPRLDIPPAYYGATEGDEAIVERYSVVAPLTALPGGGNTYLPSANKDEPRKYQAVEITMLSPEDVNQIISAIANVIEPRLSALESFMKGGQDSSQPQGQSAAGASDSLSIGNSTGGVVGNPIHSSAPQLPSQPGAGGTPLAASRDQYALPALAAPAAAAVGGLAGSLMKNSISEEEGVMTEKYSHEFVDKLVKTHEELLAETAQLRTAVGSLMQERTDAQRAYRLQELAQKYSAIEANIDEEMERVLYSAGSKMTDEEFNSHLATIERYAAQSSPPATMIPDGQVPTKDAEKVMYSQEFNDEVVRRCTSLLSQGKVAAFDEVAKALASEWGIAAA